MYVRTLPNVNLNKLRIFQVLFSIRLPTRSHFRGRSVHRGRSTDAQGKNTSRAAHADDDFMNISNDNLNEVEQGDFRKVAECYSKFDIGFVIQII